MTDLTPEAFREAREALGYTQAQLAEALDVTRQTINRYERGHEPIPRVVTLAMAFIAQMQSP